MGESKGCDPTWMLLIIALMCSCDVLGRDSPMGGSAMRLAAGRPHSSGWGLAISDAIRFLLGPVPSLRVLRRTLLIVWRSCRKKQKCWKFAHHQYPVFSGILWTNPPFWGSSERCIHTSWRQPEVTWPLQDGWEVVAD